MTPELCPGLWDPLPRSAFPRHMTPGVMIPEQPRDNFLGLIPGRFQAQAAVCQLPLDPGLAVYRGVGVQLLVHLLEFPLQVIQELLAVLA
ncbi:MAG: hypothetical protein ACK55Z_20050 [bacterium]